jgi:hypothetical protein
MCSSLFLLVSKVSLRLAKLDVKIVIVSPLPGNKCYYLLLDGRFIPQQLGMGVLDIPAVLPVEIYNVLHQLISCPVGPIGIFESLFKVQILFCEFFHDKPFTIALYS